MALVMNSTISYTGSVDDGKRLADELRRIENTVSFSLSNELSDFIFSLEVNYQTYYKR